MQPRQSDRCAPTRPSSRTSIRLFALAGALALAPALVPLAARAQESTPTRPPRQPLPPPSQRKPVAPPPTQPATTPSAPADGTPAPTTPGSPATIPAVPGADAPPPPRRAEPTVGAFIERVTGTTKDWTLTANLRVNSEASDARDIVTDSYGRSVQMPKKTPFEFETMTVVFPIVTSSAGADALIDRSVGKLRIDGKIVSEEPQPMAGKFHSGARLLRFQFNNTEGLKPREVSLEVALRATCSQTTFNEKAALDLPWPKGPWPDEAVSTLAPQLFVDLGFDPDSGKILPYADDNQVLDAAITRYLKADGISDPKTSTPIRVAKAITKGVWSEVQPSGDGLKFRRVTAEFSSVELTAPHIVLAKKKGSEHDITCLMAALLRKVALPTRTVIGWDVSGDDNKGFLRDAKKANKLRSWVEVCLFDEANNTINWVPIDAVRARKTSSRPPAGTQPWKYFGAHDELNEIVPFALQFHPPTDVVSYGTGSFWGWFVTPKPPDAALQAISFRAERTSVRGGPPGDPADPKNKDNEGKPKVKRGG